MLPLPTAGARLLAPRGRGLVLALHRLSPASLPALPAALLSPAPARRPMSIFSRMSTRLGRSAAKHPDTTRYIEEGANNNPDNAALQHPYLEALMECVCAS